MNFRLDDTPTVSDLRSEFFCSESVCISTSCIFMMYERNKVWARQWQNNMTSICSHEMCQC